MFRGAAQARPGPCPHPGAAPNLSRAAPGAVPGGVQGGARTRGGIAALSFAAAARTYWGSVHRLAGSELANWRQAADAIPDPDLRRLARHALAKRANMEGAAAFATFVPAQRRAAVVRAAVAFQSAYNYLDAVAEQPSHHAVLNARALHAALPAMLCEESPGGGEHHFYEHCRWQQDGGYLRAMMEACRQAAQSLPSFTAVQGSAVHAAERVARFQAFNCGRAQGDLQALRRLGQELAPPAEEPSHIGVPAGSSPLTWWEAAAATGSSLGVFAMLALAADSGSPTPEAVEALEHLYFPWVGALHSMLDQLVDVQEDERTGQINLYSCYACPAQAQMRLGWLAGQCLARARELDVRHTLITTAMSAMYLASADSRRPAAGQARCAVLRQLGPLVWPAIAIFRITGIGARPSRGVLARAVD